MCLPQLEERVFDRSNRASRRSARSARDIAQAGIVSGSIVAALVAGLAAYAKAAAIGCRVRSSPVLARNDSVLTTLRSTL
ncbi:MAG TPA: hypothetical protein VGO08_13655, partial [Burkholderiales bacterium]|nr:hypothetical protein [Burkholderiales bacterium]